MTRLDDPQAAEFASLLLENWTGDHVDEVLGMLEAVGDGTLKPEFPIPSQDDALMSWLDLTLDESALNHTRQELRGIAKTSGANYDSGVFIPARPLG